VSRCLVDCRCAVLADRGDSTMNTGENGFQTRAARMLFAATLQPEIPPARPGSSAPTSNLSMTEKRPAEIASGSRNKSLSVSSNGNTLAPSGENAAAEDYAAQRAVRTIPSESAFIRRAAARISPIQQ